MKKLNIGINIILSLFILHTFLLIYVLVKNFNYSILNLLLLFLFSLIIFFYIYLIFIKKTFKLNAIVSIIAIYFSIYLFEFYIDTVGTTFKNKKQYFVHYMFTPGLGFYGNGLI